ncbi:MAG: inorganic diphosphatase [Candidatus Marsarchaeota archaeon]|jgi:Inorganic pyrophosphatase|nr:inorganic diphosphatase [Candidatus Marsarchaeota archaeon]
MISDAGKRAPDIVNVIIEIPKDGNVKYEYDMEKGLIKVDRVLYTSMVYPFNYGFVTGTLGEDGDPLDIVVLSNTAFFPGSFLEARPIGVLLMKDEEGVDSKIIATPTEKADHSFKHITDINDLDEAIKGKIGHFFSYYKTLEPGKWVEVTGWEGAEGAKLIIKRAIARKGEK